MTGYRAFVGDKVGHRTVIVLSILLAGVGTVLTGFTTGAGRAGGDAGADRDRLGHVLFVRSDPRRPVDPVGQLRDRTGNWHVAVILDTVLIFIGLLLPLLVKESVGRRTRAGEPVA